MSAAVVYIMWREWIAELKYQAEIFKIRWVRISAYTNRFEWEVVQPIKEILYHLGVVREKPLIVVAKELRAVRELEEKRLTNK